MSVNEAVAQNAASKRIIGELADAAGEHQTTTNINAWKDNRDQWRNPFLLKIWVKHTPGLLREAGFGKEDQSKDDVYRDFLQKMVESGGC